MKNKGKQERRQRSGRCTTQKLAVKNPGNSKLLKNYRDAVWNLELAVQQVKKTFEIEYESSIDEFLESIYLAGADLSGTKLENYAKSIERSNKMLKLLTSAVDIMRNKHKHGEQYYWLLYYTYLSPQQLQDTDEIIEKLQPHIMKSSVLNFLFLYSTVTELPLASIQYRNFA